MPVAPERRTIKIALPRLHESNGILNSMINIKFIKEVGPFRWVFRTAIRQFHKRIVKRDHTMRLPTGEWITLPVSNHFATEAFITEADVDWGSDKLLGSLLSRKGVFLDVGAHIGYYSLYMLPLVSAVYSFEPDPRVRVFLQQNVAKKPNVEVIPCAVGATQGKARFTLELDAAVSHLSEKGDKADSQIEVDVVTVDEFVSSRSVSGIAIQLVGIDIVGDGAGMRQQAADVSFRSGFDGISGDIRPRGAEKAPRPLFRRLAGSIRNRTASADWMSGIPVSTRGEHSPGHAG